MGPCAVSQGRFLVSIIIDWGTFISLYKISSTGLQMGKDLKKYWEKRGDKDLNLPGVSQGAGPALCLTHTMYWLWWFCHHLGLYHCFLAYDQNFLPLVPTLYPSPSSFKHIFDYMLNILSISWMHPKFKMYKMNSLPCPKPDYSLNLYEYGPIFFLGVLLVSSLSRCQAHLPNPAWVLFFPFLLQLPEFKSSSCLSRTTATLF